jgi:hypothetical protein
MQSNKQSNLECVSKVMTKFAKFENNELNEWLYVFLLDNDIAYLLPQFVSCIKLWF